MVVNPRIPPMFKTESDRLENLVSEACKEWMVQDQELFTWLLSKISKFVILRLLSCKHAYDVWDKVHRHYNAYMKAKVHQLHAELKMIKKGTQSIFEFMLHIRSIVDSLLAIGDPISERDQINVILQGLPKDYIPFIMMAYNKTEPMDIYEVGGLLYI